MKRSLIKFLISHTLDRGKPLPRFWQKRVARSQDLRQFHDSARGLDRLLRDPAQRPPEPDDPWLHQSIMHAIRNAASSGRSSRSTLFLRWAWAALAGLLLVSGSWWIMQDHRPPDRLPSPAPALDLTRELTVSTSAEITTPLLREMENLRKDVEQTTQFLVASLP